MGGGEGEGEGWGARQGFSQAQWLVSHTRASQPINRKCYSQYPVPDAVWDVVGAGGGVSFQMCRLAVSGAAPGQDTWPYWLPFLPSISGPLRV